MRSPDRLDGEGPAAPSTDAIEHASAALAVVGAFLLNLRSRARKSAIKVRGGRARARQARRDARGRFLAQKSSP